MINIRVLKGCRLYEGEQDLLLRALQYQRLAYYVTDLFFTFSSQMNSVKKVSILSTGNRWLIALNVYLIKCILIVVLGGLRAQKHAEICSSRINAKISLIHTCPC